MTLRKRSHVIPRANKLLIINKTATIVGSIMDIPCGTLDTELIKKISMHACRLIPSRRISTMGKHHEIHTRDKNLARLYYN